MKISKVLTAVVLCMAIAVPANAYMFPGLLTKAQQGVFYRALCHHARNTAGPMSKGGFELASAPMAFMSTIFITAFIIGHDHWLGCKQAYPTHSESDELGRAVCQGSWAWPLKSRVVSGQMGGNGGNFVGGNDK